MANAIYPLWKQALLDVAADEVVLNDVTLPLKVALVAGYTYSAAHDFYNDVSSTVVGTPQTIGSVTVLGGVVDGNNVTFTAVSGSQVTGLVFYLDTGTASTSRLVAYLDTGQTGLPVTPNGGDITITWNASGIFAL